MRRDKLVRDGVSCLAADPDPQKGGPRDFLEQKHEVDGVEDVRANMSHFGRVK
jgi:hypothetical protein